jgi:hypothetical protein
MAIGPVLAVLSNLPWGTIVESAPKVAENASRLWEAVRKRGAARKAPGDETQSPLATAATPDDATAVAHLQGQLNELRAVVGNLEDELRASAGVIRDLAEQNALLIERVERARRRLKSVLVLGSVWLALLTAAAL